MAHITQAQRYTISCMLHQGYKQIEIALAIGKDKSVISKKLNVIPTKEMEFTSTNSLKKSMLTVRKKSLNENVLQKKFKTK